MPRVDGFLYSINFGYIASSLAIICAAMFFLGHRHKIIYLVGFIAASLAMLFSGTRGALIAYLITSFIISAFNLRKGNIKVVVIFSLIITLCLYALYGFNKSFSSRINNTISKVEAILNQDKGFTSVNARFEIWKSVLYMTKDNLWLGTGYNERAQKLQELIKQGKISKDIPFGKGHRNHGHNEVMEALVSKGLFGVLALLAFYWAFLRLFFKKAVGKKSETQYIAAVCGFLFVLQFILCGLTEAPLLRNAISAFFIVTVSFFIASLADKPIFSPD